MKLKGNLSRDYELKLRRKVRIYKDFFLKRLMLIVFVSMAWFLYCVRGTIRIVIHESMLAYEFSLRRLVDAVAANISLVRNGLTVKVSGLKNLKEKDALRIVGDVVSGGAGYDVMKIKKALEKNPMIRSVRVVRNLTRMSIDVYIHEREFVGVFQFENGIYFGIDSESTVLQLSSVEDIPGAPISVKNTENYEALLPVFSYLKYRNIGILVSEMVLISNRRWNLRFKNGLLVKLPSRDWHKAIDILLYIDKRLGVFSDYNKIAYIDLRVEGRVFLK